MTQTFNRSFGTRAGFKPKLRKKYYNKFNMQFNGDPATLHTGRIPNTYMRGRGLRSEVRGPRADLRPLTGDANICWEFAPGLQPVLARSEKPLRVSDFGFFGAEGPLRTKSLQLKSHWLARSFDGKRWQCLSIATVVGERWPTLGLGLDPGIRKKYYKNLTCSPMAIQHVLHMGRIPNTYMRGVRSEVRGLTLDR